MIIDELVEFLEKAKALHELEKKGEATFEDYHQFQLNKKLGGHGNGWYPMLFQILRNNLDVQEFCKECFGDKVIYEVERDGYDYKRRYIGTIEIDEKEALINYIIEAEENGVFGDSIEIILDNVYYFIKNTDDKIVIKSKKKKVDKKIKKIKRKWIHCAYSLNNESTLLPIYKIEEILGIEFKPDDIIVKHNGRGYEMWKNPRQD